ncbi:hypothetical protein ASE23_25985 [Rhizobium sp. Root73]|uniref:PepSY domain-containing protein n=1 Tax=unclassified Rhizobium TaxID=2613769 RepID=UPI0007252495|nr:MULTISPECIES: hypothetical protein [unclassified Rhizobium]KQY14950.1 hypothetical protein ASD36_25455 [Rhizobium sp. Root1334]KRC06388.1 hypothetical protein ASE23_25985 [Rhizobium sp. Root73]
MKIRVRLDLMGLRDAVPRRRRHLGVILSWSLALSLAQMTGGSEAFADGGAAGSEANSGSNGDRDARNPSTADTSDDDSRDGQPTQRQSEVRESTDQENARAAVAQGRVLPLKDVLAGVDPDRYGTVIAVDLRQYMGKDVYRLKTRDGLGVIHELRINAHTGKFINVFGF